MFYEALLETGVNANEGSLTLLEARLLLLEDEINGFRVQDRLSRPAFDQDVAAVDLKLDTAAKEAHPTSNEQIKYQIPLNLQRVEPRISTLEFNVGNMVKAVRTLEENKNEVEKV